MALIDIPESRTLAVSDEEFALFREMIHRQAGIYLKDAKRALLASRLAKRLRHHGLSTLTEYYELLKRRDPEGAEMREMVNCITTNKTAFFREAHHFRVLKEWVAKELAGAGGAAPRCLRIWSVASSSGEEPYSIAITGSEALAAAPGWDLAVLASDIDTHMLERGEAGIYPADSLSCLSEALRKKYFLRGQGEYEGLVQVKPALRRMVTYERINLVEERWPVRGKFDAIFCRNVIIYFDHDTQRRLFERLLAHLEPWGYLFVGHSESLYWLNDLLAPVEHTVYRRRVKGAAK